MCRILVVEDEIFVAVEIESIVADLGYHPIGIAADKQSALGLGRDAEVAIIDLNLRDGPTGSLIGKTLAEQGVTVMFLTANPSQISDGVPGTVGVMAKPILDDALREAVEFAVAYHHDRAATPPTGLHLFH